MSENLSNLNVIEQEVVTSNGENWNSNKSCFVALHIGAGYHSVSKTGIYRHLCEKICSDVIKLLKQGYNARTACATAVALLEVLRI